LALVGALARALKPAAAASFRKLRENGNIVGSPLECGILTRCSQLRCDKYHLRGLVAAAVFRGDPRSGTSEISRASENAGQRPLETGR
jgi:hypothetical protein